VGAHVFLTLLLATTAHARWAALDDAEHVVELQSYDIKVAADGSYSMEGERRVRILKESARGPYGTVRLVYNASTSSLKILEAKTINEGRERRVEPRMIEDKPLASARKGFDSHNQVLIVFPDVGVGSRVSLRYLETRKIAPLPGVYGQSFVFGEREYIEAARVRIDSALRLLVKKNDPYDELAIEQSESGGRYVTEARLKSPSYHKPVDEADVQVDGKQMTWLDVSSAQEWAALGRPVVRSYEDVINAPLPALFEKIRSEAASKSTSIERMDAVTSLLADELHYTGDWRSVRGGWVPRPLDVIAGGRYGDCKDFSAATAAILRALGLRANVAWIIRGRRPVLSPNDLPIAAFNHAIVAVQDGDKTRWLDPTNRASFAQGVPEDIIDRPALVLDVSSPTLSRVPAADPEDSTLATEIHVDLSREEEVSGRGTVTATGRQAYPYAGAALDRSTTSLAYDMIRRLVRENQLKQWKVDAEDLHSRIVKPFKYDVSYLAAGPSMQTSAGMGYLLPQSRLLQLFQVKLEDRVSGLFLEQPYTMKRRLLLDNVSIVGRRALSCSIDSPWIKAERRAAKTASGLAVSDTLTLKRAEVSNDELRGKRFASLREELRRCFDNVAVIYRGPQKLATEAADTSK
jgi:transglutaminase-like putative cysteine protease